MINKNGKEALKNIQLKFIGNCRFMASSLDKMASNLNGDQYKSIVEFYKREEVFQLMRRKGIYPYEPKQTKLPKLAEHEKFN